MSVKNEINLFNKNIENTIEEHWVGMPEFHQTEIKPLLTIQINFETLIDFKEFEHLLKKYIYKVSEHKNILHSIPSRNIKNTKITWFPLQETSNKYLVVDSKEHTK